MADLIPALLLLAFSLVFVGVLFLFLRSIVLWYLRISETIKALTFIADSTGMTLDELRAIRRLLENQQSADHVQPTSSPSQHGAVSLPDLP